MSNTPFTLEVYYLGLSYLMEYFQIVYSEETLNKIDRNKGYEDTFLNLLEDLNAIYINHK